MDKFLNKVKWQLYMRRPGGGIYDKCLKRMDKEHCELLGLFNGEYLDIPILDMYLNGYYLKDYNHLSKFFDRFRKLDCVKICNYSGVSFYKININDKELLLKCPNMFNAAEMASFRFELLDLIMPYLISDIEEFKNLSFNEGPYEYVSDKVDTRLKEGDVVFDLGANFGMFTSYAASRGCEVYAFEPMNSAVSGYLKYLDIYYNNVHIINKAVSDKDGVARLKVDKDNYGAACLNEKDGVEVSTVSLDSFVSDNKINKVDFIKADIEGSEVLMLDGAKEVLREYEPKLAICKYHHLGDSVKIKKRVLEANNRYNLDSRWKKIYGEVKK